VMSRFHWTPKDKPKTKSACAAKAKSNARKIPGVGGGANSICTGRVLILAC
jgi:hypothetical protein